MLKTADGKPFEWGEEYWKIQNWSLTARKVFQHQQPDLVNEAFGAMDFLSVPAKDFYSTRLSALKALDDNLSVQIRDLELRRDEVREEINAGDGE